MIHQEFTFDIYKTHFFGQYWKALNTKAVIVLAHGMGGHSSRYTPFVIPKLIESNFSVVAFDHFGHGKTTGKRGHCPSYEAVLDSISATIEKAKSFFPNKPIFLYGHSMGGNAVVNYPLRKKNELKGIIASSPFLKLAFQPPSWKLILGRLMQKIAPSITLNNELDTEHISHIEKEVEKYQDDPLVHNRISSNFSISFIEAGKWAIENAEKLKTPMLLVHGTGDKITDHKSSKQFAEKSIKASLKLYEDGFHELHNDFCKEEVLTDIIKWINSQLQD